MQKIVNVLAVASAVVSLAVVGSAGYVYVRKDAIIESVKQKALEAVTGSLGGLGGVGEGSLPLGTPDLAPPSDSAAAPTSPIPSGNISNF